MMFDQLLNIHSIFKRLAKALIRLRVCACYGASCTIHIIGNIMSRPILCVIWVELRNFMPNKRHMLLNTPRVKICSILSVHVVLCLATIYEIKRICHHHRMLSHPPPKGDIGLALCICHSICSSDFILYIYGHG